MPTAHLDRILTDTGFYQAEYKLVQALTGGNEARPSECQIPNFNGVDLTPNPVTPPPFLKECIIGFIPIPLAPAPFVDLTDITIPCAPGGFLFRSNEAGTGKIAYPPTSSIDPVTNTTEYLLQGTGTQFLTEIKALVDLGAPYPNLEVTVNDVRYSARVHSVVNALQLKFRTQFRSTVKVGELPAGSVLAGIRPELGFVIKRIVFTTSSVAPTSGDLFFLKTDTLGCSGAFVGDININVADVNLTVPCPTLGEGSSTGDISLVNDNYSTPAPGATDYQNQKFSYQLVAGNTNGVCTFKLQLTGSPNLKIPKLIFSNAGNVQFTQGIDPLDGARTISANGPAGGGGANCCVWQ